MGDAGEISIKVVEGPVDLSDTAASDLFCKGRDCVASDVSTVSKFLCTVHTSRDLVISVCDS